ncbi:molybdopterin-guanine dinucleotide biosynthesis protein B [Sphaerotilus microaerophilus]|uniref:Molybdopterin-guanine dinucleotide biosynthesis protein B (MobB) domain-containing protein n=1 Tax=Sphaerotilus microaerophilus TaxID=2914710 RepID=A0ABM7YHY2_9BURK|nr:hypothetical protein CATMQ487_07720 [Sphaerotilus sp. FB-5]
MMAPILQAQRETDAMKVFGMAGWSGSGKTTLVERLIPVFTGRGLRSRERTTERQARRRQDVAFARWAVRRGRRWAARAGRVGARGSQGWRAAQVLLGGQIRP